MLSFPGTPTEEVVDHSFPPRYGTAVAKRSIWESSTYDVVVWVDQVAERPPPERLDPFLRSYLPTSHGGRIVRRFTLPAAIETVPCSTPSGACPGTVSGLAVLDGRTLYMVHVRASRATDEVVIGSFRPDAAGAQERS